MTDGSEPTAPARSSATAYDRLADPVLALDEEWRVTYLNERAADVLGRCEPDVLGRSVWEALPDAVGSTFRGELERAMASQEATTFRRHYEPQDTWFEARAHPSETGLTVQFRDVTEEVRRADRLERRERALREVYEVVSEADASFYERVDSLLGVVRGVVGTDYATFSRVRQGPDEYVFEAVDAPADAELEAGDTTSLAATNCERVVETGETLALRDVATDAPDLAERAGNAKWGISCYLGAPVTVDGEVFGTFCFFDRESRSQPFTDWEVTFVDLLARWVGSELERRRRERELKASNERLEQFAYAASHDLQEPLRMVSSYLSLLEHRYGDDLEPEAWEFVDYAVDGADRMREMIDGLLAYSRVQTRGDPFEPVDLEDVLADVREEMLVRIEESGAEITAESLPTVAGDRRQLQQVFGNLVENAVEYSGDDPPRVRVAAERSGNRWVVSVEDEGIGIDPDDQDRVFEVFQRLHSREDHEGPGIGLALCERIVERHGGDIWVESEPGEGATFTFTLPTLDDE
jgi:signal transduction histidine kinase